MIFTVLDLAKIYSINKVCINGVEYDIRQLDKEPFRIVPKTWEIIDSIYNEKIMMVSA